MPFACPDKGDAGEEELIDTGDDMDSMIYDDDSDSDDEEMAPRRSHRKSKRKGKKAKDHHRLGATLDR